MQRFAKLTNEVLCFFSRYGTRCGYIYESQLLGASHDVCLPKYCIFSFFCQSGVPMHLVQATFIEWRVSLIKDERFPAKTTYYSFLKETFLGSFHSADSFMCSLIHYKFFYWQFPNYRILVLYYRSVYFKLILISSFWSSRLSTKVTACTSL